MRRSPLPDATTRPVAVVNLAAAPDEAPRPAPPVPRLLWGWPEIVGSTGIPRRTLEREIAARRFPKPVKRVGRRPFWRPADIIAWAEGGGRP
jgi:predicted DNA-binding transcriptional regulator AlpA